MTASRVFEPEFFYDNPVICVRFLHVLFPLWAFRIVVVVVHAGADSHHPKRNAVLQSVLYRRWKTPPPPPKSNDLGSGEADEET